MQQLLKVALVDRSRLLVREGPFENIGLSVHIGAILDELRKTAPDGSELQVAISAECKAYFCKSNTVGTGFSNGTLGLRAANPGMERKMLTSQLELFPTLAGVVDRLIRKKIAQLYVTSPGMRAMHGMDFVGYDETDLKMRVAKVTEAVSLPADLCLGGHVMDAAKKVLKLLPTSQQAGSCKVFNVQQEYGYIGKYEFAPEQRPLYVLTVGATSSHLQKIDHNTPGAYMACLRALDASSFFDTGFESGTGLPIIDQHPSNKACERKRHRRIRRSFRAWRNYRFFYKQHINMKIRKEAVAEFEVAIRGCINIPLLLQHNGDYHAFKACMRRRLYHTVEILNGEPSDELRDINSVRLK